VHLEKELRQIQERIRIEAAGPVDADLVLRGLAILRVAFSALPPEEQAEALQLLLKEVRIHPEKLVMEVFELPEFVTRGGSKNRSGWLPGQNSNL
jgi:hypothetical protein